MFLGRMRQARITDFGLELKSVNMLMVMGKVLYVIAESGFGLESVKVAAQREKRRPVITESGLGLKEVKCFWGG
ncbi:MAG: hypothetical protein AVO38_12750 [delta proteobacterium ML8_D]|nr:MAG: hypothetical protein AVO38_12750 [delta proteobacterium ML8_D]